MQIEIAELCSWNLPTSLPMQVYQYPENDAPSSRADVNTNMSRCLFCKSGKEHITSYRYCSRSWDCFLTQFLVTVIGTSLYMFWRRGRFAVLHNNVMLYVLQMLLSFGVVNNEWIKTTYSSMSCTGVVMIWCPELFIEHDLTGTASHLLRWQTRSSGNVLVLINVT